MTSLPPAHTAQAQAVAAPSPQRGGGVAAA